MSGDLSRLTDYTIDYFVAVGPDQTLQEALEQLSERGGREWWFLVVDTGHFDQMLVAPFGAFAELFQADASVLMKPLGQIGFPLYPAAVIDPELGLDAAYDLAASQEYGLVIVAAPGEGEVTILGVFHAGTRQAQIHADKPSLLELASDLLNLPLPAMLSPATASPPRDLDLEEAAPPTSGAEPEEPEAVAAEPEPAIGEAPGAPQSAPPAPPVPPAAPAPVPRMEESPPPRPAAEQPPEREKGSAEEVNVSVGGDVSAGGTINVAGRDIVYNLLPPEKQTTTQDRRFEAAFPHEAQRDETYDLWVAVALPDAPPFFTDEQEARIVEEKPESAVPVEFEVDSETGDLKPATVEVQVTGDGFEVVGSTTRILTIRPDGTPDKRRFLVKAIETGPQRLVIEFMQEGRLLKEMTIVASVFAPEQKPAGALNLSFQVVVFGMKLSFAAGGGA